VHRPQPAGGGDDDGEADNEEEEEQVLNARIRARNVWNLHGSVTGNQAMALARAKAADKRKSEAEKMVKAVEKEVKRRRLEAESITTGSELVRDISARGEPPSQATPSRTWRPSSASTTTAPRSPRATRPPSLSWSGPWPM
jgi:hypothetical protein